MVRASSARWVVASVFALAAALGVTGCGAAEDHAPQALPAGSVVAPTVGPNGQTACVSGAERPCRKVYSEQNGVVDCFDGVEVCDAETWSECLDPDTVARNMSCSVDAVDVPSFDWTPSAKTPAAFAHAWREATRGIAGGVLLLQLTDLGSDAKVAIGPSDGRLPAAFSAAAEVPRFPLLKTKTRAFHLEERATALRLRFQSMGDVVSIPVAAVKLDGRLAIGCRTVEELSLTLFIPEVVGALRFGESTIAETFGAPEERAGVRGWSLVLESSVGGS